MNEEIYNCSKEYIIKQLEQSYKIIDQLQSNWNSLREWLEVNDRYSQGYFKQVLEYMNKLEKNID